MDYGGEDHKQQTVFLSVFWNCVQRYYFNIE